MSLNLDSASKLEALFRESTGGLYAWSQRSEIIDKPILIVGLGGLGLSAVRSIKHEINTRLVRDKKKLPNLAYLAFDTEENQKYADFRGTRLAEDEIVILPSGNTRNIYNGVKQGLHEHIGEWIRNDLNPEEINNEGAGGVRQFGRMLLFNKISDIQRSLKTKIDDLRTVQNPDATYTGNNELLVFICAGISGGTGSGTFIDMPYIIRHVAQNMVAVQPEVVTTVGLLFMPDVREAAYAPRNGFAALKELNYLSNLGDQGNNGKFVQEYGGGITIEDSAPPYNYAMLISASREDRGRLGVGKCINMAAEIVVNFLANEAQHGITNGQTDFSALAYLTNFNQVLSTFMHNVPNVDRRPMMFKFLGSGTDTAKLDLDGILMYLAHEMFESMKEIYDRSPLDTPGAINTFIKERGLHSQHLLGHLRNEVSFDITLKKYLKQEYGDIEYTFENDLINYKKRQEDKYVETRKNIIDRLDEALKAAFKSRDKGPYYVSRLIYGGEAVDSLIKRLDNDISKFMTGEDVPTEGSIKRLEIALRNARNGMLSLNPLYTKNAYIKALVNYYNEQYEELAYKQTDKLLRDIRAYLNEVSTNVFNVYTEIIDIMKRVFTENADVLSKTGRTVTPDSTLFYWNIVELPDLIKGFKTIIGDGTVHVNQLDTSLGAHENIKLKEVSDRFLNDLMIEGEKWLNTSDPTVIADHLNAFINAQFAPVMRKSIDMYLNLVAQDGTEISNMLDVMFTKLGQNSKVMFPYASAMPNYQFEDTVYISVPQGVGTLYAKAQAAFPGDKNQVKRSGIYDRVFILRNTSPLPLALYRNLADYEKDHYSGVPERNGFHLYGGGIKGDKVNWKTFIPSPNVGSLWSANGNLNNEFLQPEDRDNIDLFRQALSMGYVVPEGNEMVCYYGDCANVQDILRAAGIENESAMSSASVSVALKALEGIEAELNNPARKKHSKNLFDRYLTGPDGSQVHNLEYASLIFIQMPDVAKEIRKMVDNHKALAQVRDSLSDTKNIVKIYESTIKALATDGVYKDKDNPAQYNYQDPLGIEKPLIVLETDQYKEWEYYLFTAYRQCEHRDFLTENADADYLERVRTGRPVLQATLLNMRNRYVGKPGGRDPNCVYTKLTHDSTAIQQREKLAFYKEIGGIAETLADVLDGGEAPPPPPQPEPPPTQSTPPTPDSWVCTCGTSNIGIAKFCGGCGSPKKSAPAGCPSCGHIPPEGVKAKFCLECGAGMPT